MSNNVQNRLQKAIEYKTNLKNNGINENQILELMDFSVVLNKWVKDGKYVTGKIRLNAIKTYLSYKLSSPENTFIKLSRN